MLLLGVRGYKLNFLADQFPTHLAHLYSCGGQTILGAHHYQAREGDMLPPSVQRAEGVDSESQLFCGPFFFFFPFPALGILLVFATAMGHSSDMPFLIFLGVQFSSQRLLPGPDWQKLGEPGTPVRSFYRAVVAQPSESAARRLVQASCEWRRSGCWAAWPCLAVLYLQTHQAVSDT